MNDDDTYLSLLQATIASFRYWVPAISDTARVEEADASGVWRILVRPKQPGACPFELTLSRDGRYALVVDGIRHPEQPVESLSLFLPLAEAITDGRVVQRLWSSPKTGIRTHVETLIHHGQGELWSRAVRLPGAACVSDLDECQRVDRHFLPYRRR